MMVNLGSRVLARMRSRGWLAATALAAAISLLCAASAMASGPSLELDTMGDSTVAPGGTLTYLVQVRNLGDAPTDGSEIDLVATLPVGMTGASVTLSNGFDPSGLNWSCTAGDGVSPVTGASSIKCVKSAVLFNRTTSIDSLAITVDVDAGATGVLTSRFDVSGGGAPSASTVDPTHVSPSPPPFGADGFDLQSGADASGDPSTQAGGHPYALTTSFDITSYNNPSLDVPIFGPLNGVVWPVETLKDAIVDLPPGTIGNPTVAAQCTMGQLVHGELITVESLCPPDSQIGTVFVHSTNPTLDGPIPLFNMVPPSDVPARFAFDIAGTVVTMDARVRSGSDYGISVDVRNIPAAFANLGTTVTIWGVPSDPSHDAERACPGQVPPSTGGGTCQSGAPQLAFLRNPTSCAAPAGSPIQDGLTSTMHLDSWESPGRIGADGAPDLSDPAWKNATSVSHQPPGYPADPSDWGAHQLPTGCDGVPFEPKFTGAPAPGTRAGQPTGFSFDLTIPQTDDPSAVAQSDLKKAVVTLPAGIRISPSSAAGLAACSPAQIALHSSADATCPDASKIGSVTLDTPLLPKPLEGGIYLATPNDNPFGTLLSIYLVVRGPGVVIKLPGKVEADAATGQLTTTFDDNPQLPFSNLHLEFKSGPHAPLTAPKACGTYDIHAVMYPWARPNDPVTSDSSFTISADGNGAPCPGAQFSPGFVAGTTNPVGGADSPFSLQLTRSDQDDELGTLSVLMPGGLTGRIANAVLCPDGPAQLGTCTSGSQVGTVTVGSGAGSDPFYISGGRAYITGPYKGAPFGLSIVVPAVAGPFDLGTVVVRSAIFVDRHTAQLKVVSDPFPTMLDGIALDIRDVRVLIDRPHFMVNPTSCAEKQIVGTITSVLGLRSTQSSRFQALECADMPFAPKLTLTIGARHHTRAGVSTPLTTTLTQGAGQANPRVVSVTLPSTLNALLPVLNRACTQAQFAAGQCSRARAGSAVAVTPLLRDPLRGSAYFVRSSDPKQLLPDLVVALRGQVAVDLVGKVGVNPRTGQLTTQFGGIPDVPIRKFTLRLVAGGNGPLGTTTNLCTAKARSATASIGFRAQNGKLIQVKQRLRILGCPRRGRK